MNRLKQKFIYNLSFFDPFIALYYLDRQVPFNLLNLNPRKLSDIERVRNSFFLSIKKEGDDQYLSKILILCKTIYGESSIPEKLKNISEKVELKDFLFYNFSEKYDQNNIPSWIKSLKDLSPIEAFYVLKFTMKTHSVFKNKQIMNEINTECSVSLKYHLEEMQNYRI